MNFIHVAFLLWLVCFFACLGALTLARVLRPRELRIVIIGLVTLLVLFLCLPVVTSFGRSSDARIEIKDTYKRSASVQLAFQLGSMTDRFVGEGHDGGILRCLYPEDIKRLIPESVGYSPESVMVFWTYQFRPQIVKVNKQALKVLGTEEQTGQIFFVFLPKAAVSSISHIYFERMKPGAGVDEIRP